MKTRKVMMSMVAATMAFGSVAGAGLAYAKDKHDMPTNEAQVMQNAKITMLQAVQTAEQALGGKAVGTGIDDENGVVNFEVEILKDSTKHKVLIDTQSGKIVKQVVANANDDDGDDD